VLKVKLTTNADDDELVRAVKVYVLADNFRIRGLQDYALQRQDDCMKGQWTGADLVDCIREVYRTTNGGEDKMRALISGVAYQHMARLWKAEQFQELIGEGGDFVLDIVGRNASGQRIWLPENGACADWQAL
jgi:hypothetical protein